MEEGSWILSTSVPRITETSNIDRNMKIPEDLGAVIYDITNALENFGNDLKQLKENASKRIEKLQRFYMVSLNTYKGNIQQEHPIFELHEVDKLKEKIHDLKLENE